MTNGEKIKQMFPNAEYMTDMCTCVNMRPLKDGEWASEFGWCFDINWWNAEYIEPKEDTTFTFGNKNKVTLLINLDEEIYKTIKRGFLDTFEIRDVREAIINGKKVIGEAESNNAKWKEALLDATVRRNSIWNSITDSDGRNLEEIIDSLRGFKE